MGLVGPDSMRAFRRHSAVVILVVSAIITPSDIITQLLIGVPLYFLYELSIYIAAREEKKRNAEIYS